MSGGEPQIGLGLGLEMGVQIWGQLGSTGDYAVVLSFGMAWSASLDSFCVSAGVDVEEGFRVNAVTANGHGASKQSGEPSLTTDCRVAGPAGVGWMLLISASRLAPPVVLIEVPMCSPSRDKPLVETLRCPAVPISAAKDGSLGMGDARYRCLERW